MDVKNYNRFVVKNKPRPKPKPLPEANLKPKPRNKLEAKSLENKKN